MRLFLAPEATRPVVGEVHATLEDGTAVNHTFETTREAFADDPCG